MSDKIEGITLIITSMNPDEKRLNRLLDSAYGFDKIVLHIDVNTKVMPKINNHFVTFVHNEQHLSIPEAYNWMVKNFVETEWVCCQCDDDYFEKEGLKQMLEVLRTPGGLDCGVCTFKTFVTGYAPWRDKASVLTEIINRYIAPILMKKSIEIIARRWYGHKHDLTPKGIAYQSNIPAGAFFRKVIWDKVGGMNGSIAHDWILWLKMARWGVEFRYFPFIVYTYERQEGSAWFRQFKEIAGGSMTKLRQIVDREAQCKSIS